MPKTLTSGLVEEYSQLFARLKFRAERAADIDRVAHRLSAADSRRRYGEVERATDVPWFVVGIIHSLEASLRFDAHLHNGDPLDARTVHVPAGRPRRWDPAWDAERRWLVSATDALGYDGLDRWSDWSVPGIAFALERYNGFGYRLAHPHVKSPYLWSFSNVYVRGKYVADGGFSEEAVSQQCGGMVLLRRLMDMDAAVRTRVGWAGVGGTGGDTPAARPFPSLEGPEGTARPQGPPEQEAPAYPGRYLLSGIEDDAMVGILQRRLRGLGVDPGPVDDDFGVLTEHAVRLFQARSSDLSGEPLEIDGIVGPKTWGALFGAASVADGEVAPSSIAAAARDLDHAALAAALGEEGVREDPPGSNRGPRVDAYIRAAGLDPARDSYPWCMCFVFWCYASAATRLGVDNPLPALAGVHMAWQASGRLAAAGAPVRVVPRREALIDPSRIGPGMVFYIDTGGGRGHAGIVVANRNGALETVEGNTTAVSGAREGIGVFRRSRRRIEDVSLGFASYGA